VSGCICLFLEPETSDSSTGLEFMTVLSNEQAGLLSLTEHDHEDVWRRRDIGPGTVFK
jgi:hypothetical protein